MNSLPWAAFLLVLYVAAAAFVCLPTVRSYRSVGWAWWELVLPIVPFGVWFCLVRISGNQKTLSNAVIEPLLCGFAVITPFLVKVVAARYGWRTGLAYFVGWLISCVLVLIIYFFMPAISGRDFRGQYM